MVFSPIRVDSVPSPIRSFGVINGKGPLVGPLLSKGGRAMAYVFPLESSLSRAGR